MSEQTSGSSSTTANITTTNTAASSTGNSRSYIAGGRTVTITQQTTTMSTTSTMRPSTMLYGKDLKEYEDLDVDTLLSRLTADELEELNNEVDPDNTLLPANQRCRDQTTKEPTGPFKREKLLKYLEEKAKSEKDWDEKVPFEAGVKRGAAWKPKDDEHKVGVLALDEVQVGVDVDEGESDLEFEQALMGAEESDLVDLAGILGMHSMLSQSQYFKALKGLPQDIEQNTFTCLIKATAFKLLPDEPPNSTDVEDCISRLQNDDPRLTDVNCNNMKNIPRERLKRLIESVKRTKHLEVFSLANTALTDADARSMVEMLEENTSLKCVNVESNFLSGELLARMLRATLKNQNVVEFRAENQRANVLGNRVEMDMMQSIEENESLLRVGISFDSMLARYRVSDALERNYERVRLRRIGADV